MLYRLQNKTSIRLKVVLLSLLAVFAFASQAWADNRLHGLRMANNDEATRLVFDLSDSPDYSIFTLDGTGDGIVQRVVVDINKTRMVTPFDRPAFSNSPVRNLRYGNQAREKLRLVLDVAHEVEIHSFTLGPSGSWGHRLVVDLKGNGQGAAPSSQAASRPKTPVKSTKQIAALRDVVVAIDPGHGGKDPGATGKNRTREKDIVLSVARRLNDLLEKESGMRPVMTRDRDVFIPLWERIEVAKRQKADVFISIHADAARDRRARGSSVYVLSNSGATSEAARRLAQRENTAYQIGDVPLADKDDDLARVLVDLAKDATISSSLILASDLLQNLTHVGTVRKKRVEQAGFVVLKSLDIPSVLVETAFISNPDEEKRLRSASYQTSLAIAIRNGLRNYFHTYAPPDSLLANLGRNEHVIREGETLSTIAQHYEVNVNDLRIHNSLKSDRIRIGQVLHIPSSDT